MPVPGRFPAIAAAMAALPALAFFPPEDSRDGVTVRLIGFDEGRGSPRLEAAERDGAAPFEFDVSVENATGAAIDAPLSVWLNDDWEVAVGSAAPSPEAQTMPCAASPHSTNVLHFSAIPREGRVLPALYPSGRPAAPRPAPSSFRSATARPAPSRNAPKQGRSSTRGGNLLLGTSASATTRSRRG